MGFFNQVEKVLTTGVSKATELLHTAEEKSAGWGQKVDSWLADEKKWDGVKETFADVKEKAEEAVNKVFPDDLKVSDDATVAPEPEQTVAPEEETPLDKFASKVEEVVDEALAPENEVVEAEIVEEEPVPGVDLSTLSVPALRELAKSKGVKGYSKLRKDELIAALS